MSSLTRFSFGPVIILEPFFSIINSISQTQRLVSMLMRWCYILLCSLPLYRQLLNAEKQKCVLCQFSKQTFSNVWEMEPESTCKRIPNLWIFIFQGAPLVSNAEASISILPQKHVWLFFNVKKRLMESTYFTWDWLHMYSYERFCKKKYSCMTFRI